MHRTSALSPIKYDELCFLAGELTPRQAAILIYVLACWRKGWLPNYREIAEHFDCAWGTVWKHITALRKKGYLCDGGAKKPLRLTTKALKHGYKNLSLRWN